MTVIAVDFTKKAKKKEETQDDILDPVKTETVETSFEEIARKNKERADRKEEERKKANKDVLRSYRIK